MPWFGRLVYYLLPYRRGVVLGNLRRVFAGSVPELEIRRLAQAYYAHYVRFLLEFFRLPFMSAERRQSLDSRRKHGVAHPRAHRKARACSC